MEVSKEAAYIRRWYEQRKASCSDPLSNLRSHTSHVAWHDATVSVLHLATVVMKIVSAFRLSLDFKGWCLQCHHPCSPVAGRPGAWFLNVIA